jgi:GT2 family glycosyltransferase
LTRWGEIIGNFGADPGRRIEVDHLIGCNMSWRRDVLSQLGGLRELFIGTEVREETDIALRVRSLGYRLVFEPKAVVDHVGAPQAKGARHGARYVYYASRNHLLLLAANFGLFHPVFWRFVLSFPVRRAVEFAKPVGRAAMVLCGNVAGFTVGLLRATLFSLTGQRSASTHSAAFKHPVKQGQVVPRTTEAVPTR